MNCSKCNAPLETGALFCGNCGTKVEQPQPMNQMNQNPYAAQAAPAPKKPFDKKILAAIIAAAAVFLIAIIVIIMIVTGKKKMDLQDYTTVKFDGYQTVGTAEIEFDWSKFHKDLKDKAKGMEDSGDINSLEDIADGLSNIGAYGKLINVTFALDKSAGLSNGDVVKVKFTYDNEAASEYGIKYVGEEIEYEVEGLKEIKEIDPFKDITLKYSGTAPDVSAEVVNDSSEEAVKNLYFNMDKSNGLAEGDIVTVSVDTDADSFMEEYGAKLTSTSKEFKVDKVDTYITSAAFIGETLLADMQEQTEDVIDAYAAEHKDQIKISKVAYKGSYFLTEKSTDHWGEHNFIYMVYTAKVTSKEKNFKAQTIYLPVKFSNLIKYADGTDYVEMNVTDIEGRTDLKMGWFTTVNGYTKLSTLKNELVTANKGTYIAEAIGDVI